MIVMKARCIDNKGFTKDIEVEYPPPLIKQFASIKRPKATISNDITNFPIMDSYTDIIIFEFNGFETIDGISHVIYREIGTIE